MEASASSPVPPVPRSESPLPSGTVTAFWPALGKVSEQRIQIQSGVTQDLKFEFAFSQSEYDAALRAQAAENTGGSAGAPALH